MTTYCAIGQHDKCRGRITVPNWNHSERKDGYLHQTLACGCLTCAHPPVPEDQRRMR